MSLEQELEALEANIEIKKLAVRHEATRKRVQKDKSEGAIAEYKAVSKELADARRAARGAGITLASAPGTTEKKQRRWF